jgi:hypothetical protein
MTFLVTTCPQMIIFAGIHRSYHAVFSNVLTLLYLSRVNSDPGTLKDTSKSYYCEKSENLHDCSLLCGYIMTKKLKGPFVNNGHDKAKQFSKSCWVNSDLCLYCEVKRWGE